MWEVWGRTVMTRLAWSAYVTLACRAAGRCVGERFERCGRCGECCVVMHTTPRPLAVLYRLALYTQSFLLCCTDWLSVPELHQGISAGLRAAGLQQLDILAFDACLMSNYEVASQLAPVAR